MDIGLGSGLRLSAPQQLLGQLRGQVQIDHQIRLRQFQPPVFQVKQPVQIRLPLGLRELCGLVDGVGGSVPVGQNQPAGGVYLPPVLLEGGVAVHGVEGGGGVGADVAGSGPQRAVEIEPCGLCEGVAVAWKVDLMEGDALRLESLGQQTGLGCLARAVRALKHNQFSAHDRLSPAVWSRNRGSFIIRPNRLGFLISR